MMKSFIFPLLLPLTVLSSVGSADEISFANSTFCKRFNGTIDAVLQTAALETIYFKGDIYSIVNYTSEIPVVVNEGKIVDRWSDIVSGIDAAFTINAGPHEYLIKGDRFWKYNSSNLVHGYPKSVRETFPKGPESVAAATYHDAKKRLYLFSNTTYYSYIYDKFGNFIYHKSCGIPSFKNSPHSISAAVCTRCSSNENPEIFIFRGEQMAAHTFRTIREGDKDTFFPGELYQVKVAIMCEEIEESDDIEDNTQITPTTTENSKICNAELKKIIKEHIDL